MFEIGKFKSSSGKSGRYERRLSTLLRKGIDPDCIDTAVSSAIKSLKANGNKSFVIYGEPQSGKTEMMIALTAKLLDEGHRVIIHLLNDNILLLEQNLDRFKRSGLAPSPKNFIEILDPAIGVQQGEWVIF